MPSTGLLALSSTPACAGDTAMACRATCCPEPPCWGPPGTGYCSRSWGWRSMVAHMAQTATAVGRSTQHLGLLKAPCGWGHGKGLSDPHAPGGRQPSLHLCRTCLRVPVATSTASTGLAAPPLGVFLPSLFFPGIGRWRALPDTAMMARRERGAPTQLAGTPSLEPPLAASQRVHWHQAGI